MAEVWQIPGCPEPPNWTVDVAALRELYPWLEPLGECPQDPIFHAEGDVLTHLGMVLTELAALPAFRALPEQDRHIVFAATLLHDISKPECTRIEEDGRVRSPGHAVKGVYKARRILTDDEAFAPHGTPFEIREQILALVRWHGLPGNYLDKPDPQRAVILTSLTTRMDLLTILAEADHRGRIVKKPDDTMTRIELFRDFCDECESWSGPRAFANNASRVHYFRTPSEHPTLHLFDDSKCEVTVLSGLPGSGKDTWVSERAGGREIISLDDIRRELDVEPGDDQSAVVAAAYDRAKALLRRGEPFVWNATNVSRILRGKVIDLSAAYKARIRVVYLEPPIPLIRSRNTGRTKRVPERVWERLFDKLDVPTLAECHEVEYLVGTK
ncbi:HD domain protein [Gemmata sp. SH-PL17]|uniref:AAA family ATPase n=1 Tax=Gemmata sp. SH-PL17 TaxID=1630693 RepID=UPI00078B70B0|nr:AAA family ATPase [Gemmata sp. SH-PL17]AMV30386.1 HD domain protein [Gemmata sp. SH-PL17]